MILQQLRLEECSRPTAKGMEYDYRIYDGKTCVYAWHEMSKRDYDKIYLKRSGDNYLRTSDGDSAVAIARYPAAQHYAEQALIADRHVAAKDLRVDAAGIIEGEF